MLSIPRSVGRGRAACAAAFIAPTVIGFVRATACLAACAAALCAPGVARAQPGVGARVSVGFQVTQTTTLGQSVYVIGTPAELGGVDPGAASVDYSRAVKLEPSAYPVWRLTVSLPAPPGGSSYSYRYVLRSDGPGQSSVASNGTPLGSILTGTTAPAPAGVVASKAVVLTFPTGTTPVLSWRTPPSGAGAAPAFQTVTMRRYGPVPGRPGDTRWYVTGVGTAGAEIEFFAAGSGGGGTPRVPATGTLRTALDGIAVQDGQVFSYLPAASPGAPRRDYNPASPPALFSPQFNQTRAYRVYLPRGYDQHAARRYPVLYMHDGQNVFESGPFGSWNAAPTIAALQQSGAMREVIVVGLDNVGSTRISDYAAPDDGGRANLYARYVLETVKPLIDAQYRTLTGAETTGVMGSSMGGVASIYMAWDFPGGFTRVGNMSPAWQVVPAFKARAQSQPPRALRMHMDSGDSGTSSDNYWLTLNFRDNWAGGVAAKYPLGGTLRHVVGFGQQHNEAAWASRLPGALAFLYPAAEEPNDVLRSVIGPHWRASAASPASPPGDEVEIEDLLAVYAVGRDINLDGLTDAADGAPVERFLRRDEPATSAGRQR